MDDYETTRPASCGFGPRSPLAQRWDAGLGPSPEGTQPSAPASCYLSLDPQETPRRWASVRVLRWRPRSFTERGAPAIQRRLGDLGLPVSPKQVSFGHLIGICDLPLDFPNIGQ